MRPKLPAPRRAKRAEVEADLAVVRECSVQMRDGRILAVSIVEPPHRGRVTWRRWGWQASEIVHVADIVGVAVISGLSAASCAAVAAAQAGGVRR